MIYPWQTDQWQQLAHAKQENRLPHALLFIGIRGTGKAHFAENFMRTQLCSCSMSPFETDTSQSDVSRRTHCECHSCRLVTNRSHPNVLWIEPEKPGSAIKVDQVRDITEFVNQTSLQGEYRFVVINPASNMNANAANALLKTLEEPSSGSILILISEQTFHLPATILSRCQYIHFPAPPATLALDWLEKKLTDKTMDRELILQLAHGAPLAAMQLVQDNILAARINLLQILYALSQKQADPVKSVSSLQNLELVHILDFTLNWVMDLLRLHLKIDTKEIINKDFTQPLTDLYQRSLMSNIMQYMDYLQQLRNQISSGINLNKQLMIENILIRWMECAHVSR